MKKRPDLIRFYIRHKFKDEIPVNAKLKSYQQGDDDHHSKIEKYLEGKEKEENKALRLTSLYDDFLEEKPVNFNSSIKYFFCSSRFLLGFETFLLIFVA